MPHPPTPHRASADAALAALRARNLRVTGPRKAIVAILATRHGPFSAEELHRLARRSRCDLATVYRTLEALDAAGVARRCDLGDGVARYEFDHGEHHHHHLVCRKCRRVELVEFCIADPIERLARDRGYTAVTHLIEFFGICPKCSRRKPA